MEPVVEVFDLKKNYQINNGEIEILKGISLNSQSPISPICQGEFFIIRGSSGGGKSSFLNVVSTLDPPSSGSVRLFGKDIRESNTAELRLRKLGIVFQNFNLIPTLTCLENIELPMLLDERLDSQQRFERATYLLHLVQLLPRAGSFPSDLSGGEQQRIAIARALANDPQILFLDEPTGDLDPETTDDIMQLLSRVHKTGKTLIMVTHDERLEVFADRVVFFSGGYIQKETFMQTHPPTVRIFEHEDSLPPEAITLRDDETFEGAPEVIEEPHSEFSALHTLYSDEEEDVLFCRAPSKEPRISLGNPDDAADATKASGVFWVPTLHDTL